MITSLSPDYVSEHWQICCVLYSSAPLYFFKLEYRGTGAKEIWNDLFVVKVLEIALCRTYGTVLLTEWGDGIKCKKPSGLLLVLVI